MLDEIKEIEQFLEYTDYRWCQWSDSCAERLTGQKGSGADFYRPLLEKRLQEILNSPVIWGELIEVLRGFKFDV
jgi:hypothetical protein